jgi:membrane-bound ClpP family serine protease
MVSMSAEGALVRRASLVAGVGTLAVVAGLVLAVSLLSSSALPWVVGACLVLAVVAVVALGIHAGGHGWFVPVPVLVLAGVWAVTASAGKSGSSLAWALAALALASAVAGGVLVLPALAYRRSSPHVLDGRALVGASGTALSPLTPRGIARVNNETWTAESLSGPLPVGAPVHVARVEGLRLLVWSEAGSVPGTETLNTADQDGQGAGQLPAPAARKAHQEARQRKEEA